MSVHLKVTSSAIGAESESENNTAERKQSTKYRCPNDFVSCIYKPCANVRLNNLNDSSAELWLIKAPSSFSPDSFSGLTIPLMGLNSVQAWSENQKAENYSILSNPVATSSMHLLSTSDVQHGIACGPAISGFINICESGGDSLSNQTSMPLPACPAPRLPEGLKQRFTPFGSAAVPTPTAKRHKDKVSQSSLSAKRVNMTLEEAENKKNKKKIKYIKEEEEECQVDVPQNVPLEAVEKKKKKKKKKNKERDKKKMIMDEREVKSEPEEYD